MSTIEWLKECCKIFGCSFDGLCYLVSRDLEAMRSEGLTPGQAVENWESQG